MIDIFITHFIPAGPYAKGFNELLVNQVEGINRVTEGTGGYRVHVVYALDHHAEVRAEEHLKEIISPSVGLIKSERGHTQPTLRNKCITFAQEIKSECMVLLHNDVRVTRDWLLNLKADLLHGEEAHGRGNVIVSPRHVPYHYIEPTRKDEPSFWEMLQELPRVRSVIQTEAWCRLHGIPFDQDEIVCPSWGEPTQDGHQLMMWITRPEFFNDVGLCDETFIGAGYDDCDWGMRVLLAGKKSYQSQTAIVGHIESLSFAQVAVILNTDTFAKKWGPQILKELESGEIWPRLREWAPGPLRPNLDVADIFKLVTGGLDLTSIVDVGTGRNGVVGLDHWDKLEGLKLGIDIFAIKKLPQGWFTLIADARDLLSKMGPKSVDVVQACDVIEHLPKTDALCLLQAFEMLARKVVLLVTPVTQDGAPAFSEAVDLEPDNPYQKHLCGFTYDELEALGYSTARRWECNPWRDDAIIAWKVL